ncbi:hypothetical protein Taro_029824 [Colocasia esculenta]|uniref:Uncharacterized protein n=1 Tax=Colocasia esculenta TaxID=4460 RepID=A0A843W1F6_COLES|nr:hypothetical protein [Colocasia esculenta]
MHGFPIPTRAAAKSCYMPRFLGGGGEACECPLPLPLESHFPNHRNSRSAEMATRDRGRQQSFRSRLLSWAGTTAPPRGPSQRQPSRVTTTLAQPQSPASAEGQPSSQGQTQPRPQPSFSPSGAPARRSSSSQPPPPSSAKPPQMGAAPSRPASDTRPPWTSPGPTQSTPRAPPLTSPLSDGASPRSQRGEGAPQPTLRIPSRQLSRTYTQPPSPPGPTPQTQAAALPGPSPSPPPPPASPAPPAITTEPEAPSPTPSPALSPPAKPPSPQIRPPSPKEIPELPPPAPKVLQLEAASTKQEGKEEETTTSPTAKSQPQETSQEEDQTTTDPASMRIEVARRPPATEAGDKHISTVTHTVQHPSPEETQRDTTGGQLPPLEDEIDQKQTKDSSKPPKPEPEGEEEEKKLDPEPEPEAKEEEKLVIAPEAGQKSDPRLLHETEREVDGPDEEKRTVNQAELDQESDPYRPKDIDINPEEAKKETPNTRPLPTPAETPEIKDQRETPTSNTPETKLAPLEQTQIKDGQETAEGAEETKQTTQEPQRQPTQVHLQPIREVKLSDAPPAREKQTPLPEKGPAPPTSTTKGKEGKIAISTVARASASSRGEQSGGLHKEIKEGISRLVQSLAVQHTQQTGGGQGISIITLAGDNQGATMYVGHGTPTREGNKNVFVHKGPSANDGGDAVAPGEDSGQKKTEQQPMPTTETNANVNSNVQAVNNSILHDSCCSEENPGVHLVLSTKPLELAPQKETAKPAQLQRPRTRPPLLQKMAQEPTVRRRCLRAMFLESSDDDPQKPRRHGCRFSCEETKSAKG